VEDREEEDGEEFSRGAEGDTLLEEGDLEPPILFRLDLENVFDEDVFLEDVLEDVFGVMASFRRHLTSSAFAKSNGVLPSSFFLFGLAP